MGFDINKLSPDARAMHELIAAQYPDILVNSGHRDAAHNAAVGGAKRSEHIEGNALDYNTSAMTPQQRQEFSRFAIESGARGLGVYDGSTHFDTGKVRTWGSDFTSETAAPRARGMLEDAGLNMGATRTGSQSRGRLDEFVNSSGNVQKENADTKAEHSADNRSFEESALGVVSGLLSPAQASEKMQKSRQAFITQQQRMAEKTKALTAMEVARENSDVLASQNTDEQLQSQSNGTSDFTYATAPADAAVASFDTAPAPIIAAPSVVSTGASPQGGDADAEEEKKDPWNWRLGLTDGLAAGGLALSQMGSGKTADVSSVLNRRAQINQHATQQERLRENAAAAQRNLDTGRAQAQANSDRTFDLASYKAQTARAKNAPTDPTRYAGDGGVVARENAAKLAENNGLTPLADMIRNDVSGAQAASYMGGKEASKRLTGALLNDVTQGQMIDQASALAEQILTSDMSNEQKAAAMNLQGQAQTAAENNNPEAFQAVAKEMKDLYKVDVAQSVETQKQANALALATHQSMLREAESPENLKFEDALLNRPELQANMIERLHAERDGNKTAQVQVAALKNTMDTSQTTIKAGRERRQTYSDMRAPLDALGADGTGPLHAYTLGLRKMLGEAGLDMLLPKGFKKMGSEQQLVALNGQLIRLNRASGEGTMTDRDAVILSMTEAGLESTQLGNLMLLQMNEKENDVRTARAHAELSWINSSSKDANLDTFDEQAKYDFMVSRGVEGRPHQSVESRGIGETEQSMNAAFNTWDASAPKGHLMKFTNKLGKTMYYQQGGRVFRENGQVVEGKK